MAPIKTERRPAGAPPAAELKSLLGSMKLVRSVETRIESEYSKDEMKTPVHLAIGQEAVSAGVCSQLRRDDYVLSGHRSHGPYIAKGGDLKAMMAELYCRETGCSGGRGGSMHLIDLSVGLLGSSAIVGGTVPIAVGAALASSRLKQGRVSAAFFGDAAMEEGNVLESLNVATLWKLPVIFVCENNFYSVCTPMDVRQPSKELAAKARGFGLPSVKVDGADALDVIAKAKEAVERARAGEGPTFLECQVYRWRGHSGAGDPGAERYRDPVLAKRWLKRDPIAALEKKLLAEGLSAAELSQQQADIDARIDEAFLFAQQSPLPKAEDLTHNVYFEEGKR